MREASGAPHQDHRRAVTIEFTSPVGDDRVVGLVHLPGAEPISFVGWMSLLEVLEPVAARAAAR